MSIDKEIAGDLVATTKGQMLSAITNTKGSAGYVAIEQVSGALSGKHGTFVLMHTGIMNPGQASLSVVVVPDSGTGDLIGLQGTSRSTGRAENIYIGSRTHCPNEVQRNAFKRTGSEGR